MPPETSDAEHAARNQRGAGQVQPGLSRRGLAVQQCHGADGGDAGEDQVHVQAPAPGQVLGEHPAQQQPDRTAGPRDRAVHAERPAAFFGVAERHGEQRQRRRREQRPERPLAGPGRHQHAEVHRRSAGRGRGGEPDQAGHEGHLPAEQVSQLAAQKQEAAKRQRVRRDHPLPVHDGKPQIVLCGRQRDVHDRRI
jgi:hypothetical protein